MNIKKASYHTIMMFGSIEDLNTKLHMDKKKLKDVIETKNADGITLLEMALIYRRFEVAKHLLNNGATVNNIAKGNYNEFHYLAANLHFEVAIDCAKLLLEKDTNLELQDDRYLNSAMFALCLEALKRPSLVVNQFICDCLSKNQGIDEQNIRGNNVRELIKNRGTPEMKRMIGVL